MNRNWSARLLGIVATAVVALAPTAAIADTFTCTRMCRFGPNDELDNLLVNDGGVATLNGTVVTGNIVVEDGGKLTVKNGVLVEGNVQSFGAARITVRSSIIGGSLQIKNTPKITVKNNTIEGDLQLEENNTTLART